MQILDHVFMVTYLGLILLLSFYGIHRYWILYLYFRHYKWAKPMPVPSLPDLLPIITVQLPVYNERYVVERLIEAVCQLDYPKDRLEIQVLDDSVDDTSAILQQRIDHLREQGGFWIEHVRRSNRTGYKAGALAAGLAGSQGKYLAIFDADFIPPADFLKKTLPYFLDPGVGMVQTRWGHLNENYSLLTWIQSIFLDGHFLIEHTARNRSGAFFNFNGTAGIWRREAIATSGGWQHDTLTEDLDLSYRAQMKGWRFVYLPEVVCPAELPVDIHAFKTQQNRWTMGAIQTAKKMLPTIWRASLPLKVKVEATFHLTACIGYLLAAAFSVLMPLSLYFRSRNHWPVTGMIEVVALVGTTISMGLFYGICQRELHADWKPRLRNLPLMMSIGMGICLSNAKAVLQGLSPRQFEFRRTPKYSIIPGDTSWKKKNYRSRNSSAAVVELA
ncbi:MAG TPA: cellulose synthase family protein, partial [Elusimicrobiota bacterium]|nr:cellulose synthase family protein [Elusimicrobiota bacterium]